MEDACLRYKFGFCKFGNRCNKTHYTEVCGDKNCQGKECDKRHPVVCNYFRIYGQCKFGTFCAYGHPLKEEQQLVEEVKSLKTEVSKLKIKVDELSMKLMKIENTEKITENIVIKENTENLENTETDTDAILETNESENKIKHNLGKTLDEIIRENSEKYGKVKEKCDSCEYESSSIDNMKIHKAREHTNVKVHGGYLYKSVRKDEGGGFQCNVCDLRIPTFEEMRSHLRKDHEYLGEKVIQIGYVKCSTSRPHYYQQYFSYR